MLTPDPILTSRYGKRAKKTNFNDADPRPDIDEKVRKED